MVFIVVFFFSIVAVLNYEQLEYIDITSCQIKEVTRIGFFQLFEKATDTELSKILKENQYSFDNHNWKIVNSFSISTPWYSPHYRYHGIISDVKTLEKLFTDYHLSETSRLRITCAVINWLKKYKSLDENPSPLDVTWNYICNTDINPYVQNDVERLNIFISNTFPVPVQRMPTEPEMEDETAKPDEKSTEKGETKE